MSNEAITAEPNANSIEELCNSAIALVQSSRQNAALHVNAIQLFTYFTIGKWIVDVQQNGEQKAKYGEQVIDRLSKRLTEEFGRGFAKSNIKNIRKFYLTYKDRIGQSLISQFEEEKSQSLIGQLESLRCKIYLCYLGLIICNLCG